MVLRAAGEIGCAHCAKSGADRDCPSCARLVCETCSASWATCPEPTGREVRLGLTARVRDIDPSGRLALVSHWRQPLRAFDLRQLCWVPDVVLPRHLFNWSRANPPRLTSTGMFVHANLGSDARDYYFRGLTWRSLDGTRTTDIEVPPPWQSMQVSAVGDRVFYVGPNDQVTVLHASESLAVETRTLGVHATAKPVRSAFLDEDRALLVTGTRGAVVMHRLGVQLEMLWRHATEDGGPVTSVALAGKALVASVQRSTGALAFEVRWLDDSLTPGPLAHRIVPDSPVRATAISRDGRYFAIGTDDGLTVHDLDARSAVNFDDHTDAITCVRFASDDLLIAADSDNRVILRPRTPAGYAGPQLRVEVKK